MLDLPNVLVLFAQCLPLLESLSAYSKNLSKSKMPKTVERSCKNENVLPITNRKSFFATTLFGVLCYMMVAVTVAH